MRLIDADALIEKIHIHQKITKEQAVGEIQDDEVRLYLALHIAEEFVKMLPTIEIEQKKGRWEHIYIKRRGYTRDDRTPRTRESAYCTACRAIVPELKKISRGDSKYRTICNVFNFCPNCGADMRGGDDETD